MRRTRALGAFQTIASGDIVEKIRVFQTRTFTRWIRKSGLKQDALLQAVREIESGLVDADLGGYLYKKRIRFPGQGKRGAGRVIVATRFQDRLFFLYGFAKNERSDVPENDLKVLRELAAELLTLSDVGIRRAKAEGQLSEVIDEQQSQAEKQNSGGGA